MDEFIENTRKKVSNRNCPVIMKSHSTNLTANGLATKLYINESMN